MATPQQQGASELVSRTAPDEPQAAVEVIADIDFANFDPTDAAYWLKKEHGEVPAWFTDGSFACRWINSDPRIMPKRLYAGWEVVSPTIRQGDTILARRPKAINDADKARIAKMNRDRMRSPMKRFEMDVKHETASGNFETFDGDKGRRDGL